MNYGVIKFFNGLKGYGFITPADGSADIFVHISNVQQGYIPQQDDYVSFDTFQGRKGIEAKDVAVASQQ